MDIIGLVKSLTEPFQAGGKQIIFQSFFSIHDGSCLSQEASSARVVSRVTLVDDSDAAVEISVWQDGSAVAEADLIGRLGAAAGQAVSLFGVKAAFAGQSETSLALSTAKGCVLSVDKSSDRAKKLLAAAESIRAADVKLIADARVESSVDWGTSDARLTCAQVLRCLDSDAEVADVLQINCYWQGWCLRTPGAGTLQ